MGSGSLGEEIVPGWTMKDGTAIRRVSCWGMAVVLGMAAACVGVWGQQIAAPAGAGTVSGVVKDVTGEVVAGAHVRLVTGVSSEREVVTDETGAFRIEDVPAGLFTLVITEEGLAPERVSGKMLAGEQIVVQPGAMKIATANQSVEVTETRQELAEDEIKQQEKQRVIGVVPNFFVSYNWKAQPLTVKQKFELGWHATLDPTHFIFSAAAAGIEQADGAYPGFGPGWSGYGQRYGASLANSTTATLLRGSIMPAIFHQDPRYFYKGTGTVKERVWYALSTAVRTRGDNGKWQVSGGIAADFAAGGISNLYYAPSDRHGVGLTLENGALSTVGVGVGHLLQEFLYKRFTPTVAKP